MLLHDLYSKNKAIEDELKAKAQPAEAEEEKGEAEGQKKQKKKKGKEGATSIGFGKGVRALFDYLYVLEKECEGNEEAFKQKLDFFRNRELQSVVREILEQTNESAKRPKCAKGTRDMNPL